MFSKNLLKPVRFLTKQVNQNDEPEEKIVLQID